MPTILLSCDGENAQYLCRTHDVKVSSVILDEALLDFGSAD